MTNLGYSVSTAGDVNGDGYADVIVGAFGNDAGGSGAGRAYLYLNSLTGKIYLMNFLQVLLQVIILVIQSTAGDVNGDGYC